LAVILFLVVEGLAFVSGFVQGSTLLFLPAEEQGAYRLVSLIAEELTAPYAPLTVVWTGLELIALALTFAAVATLHSVRERKTHEVTTLCAAVSVTVSMVLKWMQHSLEERALLQLPNLLCQFTPNCFQSLELAMRADARFVARYGFWGPPSEYVILTFLIACIALLWAAALTTKVSRTWQPTPTLAVAPTLPMPEPVRPTAETSEAVAPSTVMLATPTKFCRYCGAKIPRDGMYCGECGTRLA